MVFIRDQLICFYQPALKRPLPSVRSAVLRFQAAVTAVSRPQGVVVIAPTLGSHIETAADPTFHFAGQKITLLGMAMGAGLHPGRHLLLHQLEILFVDERGNRLLDDDPFLPRLLLVAVALAVHILRRGTVINVGAYYILTNAAHEVIREIFAHEHNQMIEIQRASLISGQNAQRGQITEFIFTNI